MIYFDNSATTPPDPQVVRVFADAMEKYYGNPSSLHHKGLEAQKLLERSREAVAGTCGVSPEEIYFNSGGSEGNNLALKGAAEAYSGRGRHIVVSAVEHSSVLEPCRQLADRGFEIDYVRPDRDGFVKTEAVLGKIKDDTVLVSLMAVNNETGAVQPVADTAREVKKINRRIIFHSDGVQAFGKIDVSGTIGEVDMFTVSGHKINGLKGTGFIYIKKGISPLPLIAGGGQERGMRSGTENVPGAAALAKACLLAEEKRKNNEQKGVNRRRDLMEMLRGTCYAVNGEGENFSPYILNISLPGARGEVLLHCLEEKGFCVSTGSACSSRKKTGSHVLAAMGAGAETVTGSIRVSFGYSHDRGDVCSFAEALEAARIKLIG